MSTRERWIVYPLLFLTLGIALRDKFLPPKLLRVQNLYAYETIATPSMQAHEIKSNLCECRNLTVFDPSGRLVVRAGALPNLGGGVLETYSSTGRALVKLWHSENGGAIVAVGPTNQISYFDHTGFHPPNIWKWPVPPSRPEKSPPPDQKENQ